MSVVIEPEDVKNIRKRHGLSRRQLSESLYHIKVDNIKEWELGRRRCKPIVFWAIVLTWDKVDLYEIGIEKWREKYVKGKSETPGTLQQGNRSHPVYEQLEYEL